MSLNLSGMDAKPQGGVVSILVNPQETLLKLCNLLDWKAIEALVLPDLKKTEKGFWWRGRPLVLRIHLGIYILQALFNETDRGAEACARHNALWQVFCGVGVVDVWHVPDSTKIEEFRNRLSASTHHALGEIVLKAAWKSGFANPTWMDMDSTVQEANMAYPSDASLMTKLVMKASRLTEGALRGLCPNADRNSLPSVDVSRVKAAAKEYFFASGKNIIEKKREAFSKLHKVACEEVVPVIEAAMEIPQEALETTSTRTRTLLAQICDRGANLLADIETYIETGKMASGKAMSLHLDKVICVKKRKLGKPMEFGRVFQLGRIGGNFTIIARARSLREPDKSAAGQLLYAHARIFGRNVLASAGADRGYFSLRNVRTLKRARVKEIGIQMPVNIKHPPISMTPGEWARLKRRRAGIEPLIGHAKQGGLGKSRMKSDQTTETSAYRCVMGTNLRQLARHLEGECG